MEVSGLLSNEARERLAAIREELEGRARG
jgi:hypothetical protein